MDILGCRVGSLPSKYLGLPLSVVFKLMIVWDLVEERCREGLQGGRDNTCPRKGAGV